MDGWAGVYGRVGGRGEWAAEAGCREGSRVFFRKEPGSPVSRAPRTGRLPLTATPLLPAWLSPHQPYPFSKAGKKKCVLQKSTE